MESRAAERQEMVQGQIAGRGVSDPAVLRAMAATPREFFVPSSLAGSAYVDAPLAIGEGQTISQPYIVALMVEALKLRGGERVLEIGAGSGYAAAILSQIAGEVVAVESVATLADMARRNLAHAGCRNVQVECGDGSLGWPEAAPYDAILVSAGAPEIPDGLKGQLKLSGRLVLPVGVSRYEQTLQRVTRTSAHAFQVESLEPVRFVPLLGAGGWREV